MTALRADGYNGSVEFDGETIKILRENWRGKAGHGSTPREAPIAEVLRVDFKEPSALVNGHIRFAIPGMTDKSVSKDRFCVIFLKKHLLSFQAVQAAVEIALLERGPLTDEAIAEIEARTIKLASESSAALVGSATRKLALAEYSGHIVDYKGYRYGLGIKRDIAGATADYESGADRSRPTLTRIGAGAILAGPVGAIAGGMFKKDKTKGYVTIVFPDGATVIIDGPAKDEKKMREFASGVNRIAAAEQQLNPPAQSAAEDQTEQLLKLKQLFDAGVLTQDQYDKKTAPLIAAL